MDTDFLTRPVTDRNGKIKTNENASRDSSSIMIWHKLLPEGIKPSPREGHSSVTYQHLYFVFGGLENGKRTNSTICLNLFISKWLIIEPFGQFPTPRAQHASCHLGRYMLVHGGEGTRQDIDIDPIKSALGMSKTVQNDSSIISSNNNPNLSGICPGDGLAARMRQVVKFVDSTAAVSSETGVPEVDSSMSVLDDFYALNLESNQWHRIQCSLAPLPRKGHTLNTASITIGSEYRQCLILFGGYAPAQNTLSNTVHICECKDVMSNLERYEVKTTRNTSILDYIPPLSWRILNTTGKPPSPRYRHSCVIIEGLGKSGQGNMMIVFGGLVMAGDVLRPSNDIFLLDLSTLAWVRTQFGSDALSHRLSGDGPLPLYGHVGFPVFSKDSSAGNYANGNSDEDKGRFDMIIFGGSNNASRSASGCQHTMFRFNTAMHTWNRVDTGFLFPSERYGHSAAIISGWSPVHNFPEETTAVKTSGGFDGVCAASSAVIFGGNNSIMCASDPWVLDLTWRPAGINQFDHSVAHQVTDLLFKGGNQKFAMNLPKMLASASLPTLHPTAVNKKLGNSSSTGQLAATASPAFPSKTFATGGSIRRVSSGDQISRPLSHIPEEATVLTLKTALKKDGSKSSFDPSDGSTARTVQDFDADLGLTAANISAAINEMGILTDNSSSFLSQFMKSTPLTAGGNDQSTGSLFRGTQTGQTGSSDDNVKGEVGLAFLKVRKERAVADLQRQIEHNRAEQAEMREGELQQEVAELRAQLEAERLEHDEEIGALKQLLLEGANREAQLRILNEEAYKLLLLKEIRK